MPLRWILKGLKRGVLTHDYPKRGRPPEGVAPEVVPEEPVECPFGASTEEGVDPSACLNCGLCGDVERRSTLGDVDVRGELGRSMRRSLHVFFLDVGSCTACNTEVALVKCPYYDSDRLGIFFTPTPKHADVLLVVGAVTEGMRPVLEEAYEAMPEPKAVVAVGTCACSGGPFGDPVSSVVDVDAEAHGCPPHPLTVLEALMGVAGR